MKKANKVLAMLLAAAMVASLAACGGGSGSTTTTAASTETTAAAETTAAPAEETTAAPADETAGGAEEGGYTSLDWAAIDAMDYDEACETIYDAVLGDFSNAYAAAKEETGAKRMAMMALAEAKLLESGAFLPIYTSGGNYSFSRVVPRTNAATTLWGLDEYRYHTLLVTNELIKSEDRTHLLTLWNEAATADDYRAAAKEYLEGKGYTFADTYVVSNGYNVNIWDTIATSYTSDSMFISGTYDNLLEYDAKGVQQPGLAESYEVSDDGTVYTFHIRKGVKWVDQQGTEIGEVTADDWVASMEHLLDNADALGYLLTNIDGCGLLNFTAYLNGEITDFTQVGVKAVDDYTLEYTLEAPFAPFTTMLGYACFAPLNRDFYRSQGGTFSCEGETYTPGDFGKTPANIAYCGPYLITNFTAQNTTRYEANPTYWNFDAINTPNLVYSFNDGSDVLRAYNEAKEGTISGCGINSSALELMKTETTTAVDGTEGTYFDLFSYVSSGAGTTYCGWWNVNRGTWANYDNPDVGVSPKTEDDIARTREAMVNQHFRLALSEAFDKGSYNAVSVGDELKLARLRNSYTPGTFGFLSEDVTVDINGTATDFAAGTAYGVIEQAQLDADGVKITVWDPNGDSGAGSGDGFDGWYNVDNAKAELDMAIAELAQVGVEVSAENPIYIDYPYGSYSEIPTKMANVVKQSIEGALDGKVIINLIEFQKDTDEESATYRFSKGNEGNFDLSTGSGWGPDYGDAQSYLDTIQPYGYMCKNLGLW